MRIFSDDEGKMNLDLAAVGGDILLISQFTLHASTKKGNRPSFIEAARPDVAVPLYEAMIAQLSTDARQADSNRRIWCRHEGFPTQRRTGNYFDRLKKSDLVIGITIMLPLSVTFTKTSPNLPLLR